ncbi:hypothetical protein OC845_004226 [Tilletia horrida]|nr:hypothetical protein OC845_004226 [Tilletia horrida]
MPRPNSISSSHNHLHEEDEQSAPLLVDSPLLAPPGQHRHDIESQQHNSSSKTHSRAHNDDDDDDDDDGLEEEEENDDGDEEGPSVEAGAIPFPSQPDPSRRFRPKHYRTKRNMHHLRRWVAKNTGFLLISLAQVFYATMALLFKILNDLPPLPGEGPEDGRIGALEVISVRMFVTLSGCYIYLVFIARDPHPFLGPPEVRKLLVIRGFCGFFGLFGLYWSLQYLSLADATVITFLSPLATALLAAPLLKEPLYARQLIAGLVSIVGVILIARPHFIFAAWGGGGAGPHDGDLDMPVPGGDDAGGIGVGVLDLVPTSSIAIPAGMGAAIIASFGAAVVSSLASSPTLAPTPTAASATITAQSVLSTSSYGVVSYPVTPSATSANKSDRQVTESERVTAVIVALVGVLGSAGAYISLRCIGTRASPTHSVAYFSTWSFIVASCGMVVLGQKFIIPRDVRWAILMILIGICGLVAQILAAMGLAREKAGRATIAVYLQAPLSIMYQLILLHTPLEPLSLLGSSIVLLASIWVTLAKN